MKIKVKKLYADSLLPYRAHATDAGMDLYAHKAEYDGSRNVWNYGTGIAIEIPRGYVGLIFPRSSVYKTPGILTNHVGIVDADYRGEVRAIFRSVNGLPPYAVGERMCQMIVMPFPEVEIEEVDELSESDRGDKGFGSSGR